MEEDRLISKFSLEPLENEEMHQEKWVKRFDNFLMAKNITVAAKKKKAMLLNFLGKEVFELSESINITNEDDFLETKEKLQNYFAPSATSNIRHLCLDRLLSLLSLTHVWYR